MKYDCLSGVEQARRQAVRAKVKELYIFATQIMDPCDLEAMDVFNRLHCAVWDSLIGPELPAVRSLFRTWPQRTDEDVHRINVRLVMLRDRFIKPLLYELVGDMQEAHAINIFSQSRIKRRYKDRENERKYTSDAALSRIREYLESSRGKTQSRRRRRAR